MSDDLIICKLRLDEESELDYYSGRVTRESNFQSSFLVEKMTFLVTSRVTP